jgi:hypothetical protein
MSRICILGLLTLLPWISCSQKSRDRSTNKGSGPALSTVYDYSFAAEDSLVARDFKQFGFSLAYPRTFVLTAEPNWTLYLTLHKLDSAVAVVNLHIADSVDFWFAEDSLRPILDSAVFFAQKESRLPFVADGPDGEAYSRIDSTKVFTNRGSLRVIVVYQTLIHKNWGDALPEFPEYQEKRIAPFFWVDLWTPSRKTILEVMQPRPRADTLAINKFIVALVQSVRPLN